MANTEPGWYYAEGDPPGSQRYWDGEMWGDQYVMQQAGAAAAGGAMAASTHRVYATWIQRVGAALLDSLIIIGLAIPIFIVVAILAAVSDALGVIAAILGYLGVVGCAIYLLWVVQGQRGQSPGKRIMGLETIADDGSGYIGGGKGFGRGFLSFINSLPLYLGWLWPLWDAKNQTFTDKIFGSVVVKTDRPTGLFPLFPDGKPF